MTKTEHYQLNQWDATDPVRREDFNADNARIDAALETVKREAAAGRQALDEAVTALVAGLGKGGTNARIAWGSYTGDGTYGESDPITLTCDFKPMAVFIQTSHNSLRTELFMIRPVYTMISDVYAQHTIMITWNDRNVTFYSTGSAAAHMNFDTVPYYYVILGYDDSN